MKEDRLDWHTEQLYLALCGQDDRKRDVLLPIIRTKINEVSLETELEILKQKIDRPKGNNLDE